MNSFNFPTSAFPVTFLTFEFNGNNGLGNINVPGLLTTDCLLAAFYATGGNGFNATFSVNPTKSNSLYQSTSSDLSATSFRALVVRFS